MAGSEGDGLIICQMINAIICQMNAVPNSKSNLWIFTERGDLTR